MNISRVRSFFESRVLYDHACKKRLRLEHEQMIPCRANLDVEQYIKDQPF